MICGSIGSTRCNNLVFKTFGYQQAICEMPPKRCSTFMVRFGYCGRQFLVTTGPSVPSATASGEMDKFSMPKAMPRCNLRARTAWPWAWRTCPSELSSHTQSICAHRSDTISWEKRNLVALGVLALDKLCNTRCHQFHESIVPPPLRPSVTIYR